ncbi:MAG: molybdenum ABC transporter ATP-binding protein [Syntrophaceae bacterium]|jgi:molybdate transport system ATP-binding protein|nr:molybdenum ABC transporter ATP-binding protein [Syntrophaceae bacterium]
MKLQFTVQKQLDKFSLDMDFMVEGNRIGIFGPSGCGKTTLVGLIAGLQCPDQGRILLNGKCLFHSKEKVNIPAQHRRISMVFQHPHLFPHLSVRGNLLYGYKRCAPNQRQITLNNLVDVLQIGHLLDRGVNNLSGGEKQRVAIGRAVLANPQLLIMDEPLSALDEGLKFQIIPFLKKSCETFAIPYLFISHSLTEMRIMTEQVMNTVNGRITGILTAEELARNLMGKSPTPYLNLLRLKSSHRIDGMNAYRFGSSELLISDPGSTQEESLYELSSTDIILFKRHPEAISARNLLQCRVSEMFSAGGRIGIELTCGSEKLVAIIVQEAVRDLDIKIGAEVFAAIKATAFRKLS